MNSILIHKKVVDAGPAYFRPLVTPTIGGTLTPVVAINGGASAGSRHIDDASPTLSETEIEQIHWSFDSADNVRKVQVGLVSPELIVTAVSGTAGAVVKTHEVAYLKVTLMTAPDDVLGATRLLAGYPDVRLVYPGQVLEMESDTAITDVYVVAALTSIASPIQGGAVAECSGVSYA